MKGGFSLFLIEFDNFFEIWYAMFIKVCGGRQAHDYRLFTILKTKLFFRTPNEERGGSKRLT
jgi:hypothetical protein